MRPELRFLLVGLLLALALRGADAQPAPTDCPPQAAPLSAAQVEQGLADARDRGLLWRIARDGRVSHLYGTIHVARPGWMFLGPRVARAIAASDVVALEIDLLDPDMQRRIALAVRGGTDDAPLPEALAARLRARLDAECLTHAEMDPLAPALQAATLMALAARRDGLDPAYGVDGFLAAYARALGKSVRSLETPEAQVELLKGDPATAQQALADSLRQLELGKARTQLLFVAQLWEQGQADELARYRDWCECAETAAERKSLERLLDARNPALAEQVAALHAGGKRVFAAVGALHIVGPQGLPALLAARGFVVERVELGR